MAIEQALLSEPPMFMQPKTIPLCSEWPRQAKKVEHMCCRQHSLNCSSRLELCKSLLFTSFRDNCFHCMLGGEVYVLHLLWLMVGFLQALLP